MSVLKVLEWVLLTIVAIAQLLVTLNSATPYVSLLNGLGLGLFTLLGWILPKRNRAKIVYTLAEFGLIFYLVLVGNVPLPALLFIVLVIRNCKMWGGGSRVAVTGFVFLGYLLAQTYRLRHQGTRFTISSDQIGAVWISFFLIFGLVILFLHLLVDAALKERQGQEQLAMANTRLRQYALQVEELATIRERNRIARDLHDSLGHSLTVFGIHLEAALRQSLTALRSDPLQARSLPDAIAYLITEFQESTGVLPTFNNHLKSELSYEMNVVIYRIAQESLINIRKYAAATKVSLVIVQSDVYLKVTITDNGKGFDLNQNTTGFGLQGMRERALALMGRFEIDTAPNQGCCITVMLPL
jgi:signal transduction histidine kinase